MTFAQRLAQQVATAPAKEAHPYGRPQRTDAWQHVANRGHSADHCTCNYAAVGHAMHCRMFRTGAQL